MDNRGQIYFDDEDKIVSEDRQRYERAQYDERLRLEKVLLDRAAMRDAIEAGRRRTDEDL